MTKLESQIKDLEKALNRLKEALNLPGNIAINQDASIQRFEFTFELCWKVLQTIVNQNIQNIYGPKNVFREAAKIGLIENPVKWFGFLENRNLTVHTYVEKIARKVYKTAKEFIPVVEELLLKVREYSKN